MGDSVSFGGIGSVDSPGCREPRPQPVPRESRVGEGLEGCEGLGGDDEQSRLGVEVRRLLRHVGRVDVRDEPRLDPGGRVGAQRLVHHDGAEVGTADADVDDVRDLLAGHTDPLPRPHAVGEGIHRVENRVHVGIDILTIDDERGGLTCRAAQRRVQHRAVLRGVQVHAGKHLGEPLGNAGLLGQPHERGEDLIGDEVLRQVDVQVGERVAQAFDATGVGVEPGAQIRGESGCGIGEGGPGGRGCRIDGCVHRSHATEQSRRSQERQP